MEDTFRLRVDRVFGSLSSPSPSQKPSSSLRSLWSLTDDEIERKEWNREKHSPEREPVLESKSKSDLLHSDGFFANLIEGEKPINHPEEFEKDLDDLEDNDNAEDLTSGASSSRSLKPDDYNDEEWDIKSSIGLDCTLDYEEEEDVYDKVAVGEEQSEDQVYLKDVNDYQTDADDWCALPKSLQEVSRDPRANHLAARLRLKEDAESVNESDGATIISQIKYAEDGNLKSILKRRDTLKDPKRKRVRFDSECKNCSDEDTEAVNDTLMEICSIEEANVSNELSTLPPKYPSKVPDYVRNPAKYTHYTFDSGEMDEEANKKAYMDFLTTLRGKNQTDEATIDLPKSVTFIPKKKSGDTTMAENGSDTRKEMSNRRGVRVGIAVVDALEDEVSAMEEDEPEKSTEKGTSSMRSSRQYRMKVKSDQDEQ